MCCKLKEETAKMSPIVLIGLSFFSAEATNLVQDVPLGNDRFTETGNERKC